MLLIITILSALQKSLSQLSRIHISLSPSLFIIVIKERIGNVVGKLQHSKKDQVIFFIFFLFLPSSTGFPFSLLLPPLFGDALLMSSYYLLLPISGWRRRQKSFLIPEMLYVLFFFLLIFFCAILGTTLKNFYKEASVPPPSFPRTKQKKKL